MQIQLKRPDPRYPFVWVHIRVSNESRTTPKKAADTDQFLSEVGITLLGKWEAVDEHDMRAPALLEGEHVKSRKSNRKKK